MCAKLAEAFERQAGEEAAELRGQLAAAKEQAHTAEARAQEIERRARELRTELDRAHQAIQAATAERDQARAELATVKAKAEAAGPSIHQHMQVTEFAASEGN